MGTGNIQNVTVIGAGLMGNQIAELFARQGGCNVMMVDIKPEFIDKAIQSIATRLENFFVSKGKMSPVERAQILSQIKGSVVLEEAVRAADLVIEAVVENMNIKKEVFAKADGFAPAKAILASNTSYLNITEMGSGTGRPDKVIGMHFFNPVALMKLVEIPRGSLTSDATVAVIRSLAIKLEKEPVVCWDTSFGFIANRVYAPMRQEAVQMVWERVASPEDIDKAAKLGFNLPIGPLELGDMVGSWGLWASSEADRIRELGIEKGRLHPLVRTMVRAGYTGGTGKKGIYDFWKDVLSK